MKQSRFLLKINPPKDTEIVIRGIFICMSPKPNKIIVRLTEQQTKWLMAAVMQEELNKSEVIRRALNFYLIETIQPDEKKNKK